MHDYTSVALHRCKCPIITKLCSWIVEVFIVHICPVSESQSVEIGVPVARGIMLMSSYKAKKSTVHCIIIGNEKTNPKVSDWGVQFALFERLG